MILETIYVITKDRLIPHGDLFVVKLFKSDDLITAVSDTEHRDCEDGDILSIDPGGYPSGRISGTAGPYELCKITSKGLLYSPAGNEGSSFLVPYAE